jgi:uncharacterized membrane protein
LNILNKLLLLLVLIVLIVLLVFLLPINASGNAREKFKNDSRASGIEIGTD